MNARGWDDPAYEPAPLSLDPDTEYDLRNDRIDSGLQCATRGCCAGRAEIARETNCGLPCFYCTRCRVRWYDSMTQPTQEAA